MWSWQVEGTSGIRWLRFRGNVPQGKASVQETTGQQVEELQAYTENAARDTQAEKTSDDAKHLVAQPEEEEAKIRNMRWQAQSTREEQTRKAAFEEHKKVKVGGEQTAGGNSQRRQLRMSHGLWFTQ